MQTSTKELRKINEINHGKFLSQNALDIWGWGTPAGKIRAKRRVELIIKNAKIKPHHHILEFGCGTGLFSHYLAETGAKITAIDLSPDLLFEAKKKKHNNIEFLLGDIENLEFTDNTFDAVVGSSVLHHVNAGKALKEAFRVLKKNGYVAFAEPNMLNPQIAIQKNIPYIKKKLGDSPDETAFFRWKAKHLLVDTGFVDIFIQPHDFLHPLVPTIFIPFIKNIGHFLESTPLIKEIAGSILFSGKKP